jgi:hypothetical protein
MKGDKPGRQTLRRKFLLPRAKGLLHGLSRRQSGPPRQAAGDPARLQLKLREGHDPPGDADERQRCPHARQEHVRVQVPYAAQDIAISLKRVDRGS